MKTELKSANEKDGSQIFREIFYGLTTPFAICELIFNKKGTPTDYRFIKINPAFENYIGLKKSEIQGKTIREIYPNSEPACIEKYGSVVLNKKPTEFIEHSNNIGKHYKIRAFSSTENKFVLSFQDITNKIIKAEELKKSENKYSQMFNSISEMFKVIEPIYNEEGCVVDYYYLEVNPQFEKFVDMDRSQLQGKRAKSVFKTVEDHWLKIYEKVDKTGVIEIQEIYGAELDKFYKIKAWKIEGSKIAVAFSDITESKKAEIKFKQQSDFQDSLLKSFTDIVYIYDFEQKKNIYVNKAIGDVIGYSLEDLQNMPNLIEDLMHPDDYKNYCDIIIPKYQSAKDTDLIEHEYRMKPKTGDWVWLYSRESIYKRNSHGTPTQIFGLIIDVTEKKHLESKFEKTRLLLKETSDLGKIGGWELDLVTMESYLTKQTYKIHDLAPGTKVSVEEGFKFFAIKSRPMIKNLVNKAIETGESYSFESPFTTAKGKKIFIKTVGKAHFENGKAIRLYGTIQDITESRRLALHTNKLSTAIEQSPNSIFITDLSGRIEYTNPKFTEFTGYTAEEVLGRNPKFLQSGNATPEFYKELWGTLLAGKIWTGEFQNKAKDGTLFWEEATIAPIKNEVGKSVNYLAIKTDITASKKISNKLKKKNKELVQLGNELCVKNKLLIETKNKFQNLFEKSPVSIWEQDFSKVIALFNKKRKKVKDLTKYIKENPSFVEKCVSKIKILNVNVKTLKLIGVNNLEELTNHIRKVNTQKSYKALRDELISISLGYKDFYSETEFVKTDGSIIYVIVKSTMLDKYGKNIASIVDITPRKKVEEELIKAKEKAEESDMLKTEFINNMSHEIRTPMNGILGFSELLSSTSLSDQKRTNFIRIIQSSGRQLLQIIDDILEISQLGTKQVKVIESEVCLNDSLMELFSIFKSKANECALSLYFKKQLTDKQSTILTDKLKLNKVLSNLLENALKYTNKGFVEFGYSLKNNTIELFVKDTGIGINKENHNKIFDRFAQEEKNLSDKVGGLGLGLAIAKENTLLLGGSIRLESKKGEGSTFFVTIPYKPVHKTTNTGNLGNKLTILIAEDEEVNFLYLEALIKDIETLDSEIIHAKNGLEAVEISKVTPTIDLVLMDLKMPVMNGYEATQQIKKLYPNLTVIAQTAYVTKNEQELAINAGCNKVISKPIANDKLIAVINDFISKK